MPTSFLTAIHIRPPLEKKDAAKKLGGCLATIKSHGLEPFPFAEESWKDSAPRIFGGTTLIHPNFSSLTGDPIWGAGFMIVPATEIQSSVVTMTTPATPTGATEDAWHWLLKLAEDLCDAISADFGMINGFTVDSSGRATGSTPAGPEVAPGHPPGVLLPWMYWSAARLKEDGVLDGLKSITTAARSSGSRKGGWVLQAYENYSGEAPERLLSECAASWNVAPLEWMGIP